MKVCSLLCALIIIRSGFCLCNYNDLCFTRHGDYLKHPNYCHKFIRCSHGHAYEFQCPGNLLWHQEVKSCDYAYRSKCELNGGFSTSYTVIFNKNINSALEPLKKTTAVNLSENGFFSKAVDNSDNKLNKTVLITETLTTHTTEFSEIEIVTPKDEHISELSVAEHDASINLVNRHVDNLTAELSIKQDAVIVTEQSYVYLTADNIPEFYNRPENLNLADQMKYNVSELSTTENTVVVREQYVDDKVIELSTAVELTEKHSDNLTIDSVTELSLAENTFSSAEAVIEKMTAESIPELSTERHAVNLTENQVVSSTAFNVPKLSIEENIVHTTELLLEDTTLQYRTELSTKENIANLSKEIANDSADVVNLTEEILVTFTAASVPEKLIDSSITDKSPELLTAELVTTTKPRFLLSYNENKTEIANNLIETSTIYSTTETTTEIAYLHFMESTIMNETSQDNNIENFTNVPGKPILINNKNGKKQFINLNEFLTPTSKPSYSQPAADSTTQDPRLPFRAIECQGENNRQQFKALKCYQYYQCFAEWAFLLNCHEGWWFQPDMKRCIQIEDNECGY